MGTHRRERTMMVQIFGRTGVWTGLRAHRGSSEPSPAVSLRPTPLAPKARRTRYLPAPSSHLPVAEFRQSPCAIMCRTMPDAGCTRRSGRVCPGAGHAGGALRGPVFVNRVCDGDIPGGSAGFPRCRAPVDAHLFIVHPRVALVRTCLLIFWKAGFGTWTRKRWPGCQTLPKRIPRSPLRTMSAFIRAVGCPR